MSLISALSRCIRQLGFLFVAMHVLYAPLVLGDEFERSILVGFAQDTLANDWRLAQVKEIEAILAQHSHIRFIYTDANASTARQIQDIENLIHSGVDILITSPRDSIAMTPVIQQAYQRGIAVVLLTRRISTEDYTSFISPDDASIARNVAHYIAGERTGKAKILMLEGVPTATSTQQRSSAFLEAIEKYPDLNLVSRKVGNYLRNDAIRAVEEVLREGISFDVIYAHSDSMASGARMALSMAGMEPADFLIVGIDYINEARDAIIRGEQHASFTYPTSAREASEVVLSIAAGETPPRHIIVPSQQVDVNNVHQIEPIF